MATDEGAGKNGDVHVRRKGATLFRFLDRLTYSRLYYLIGQKAVIFSLQ